MSDIIYVKSHIPSKLFIHAYSTVVSLNLFAPRLSQDEIKKMVEESQKFAKMDKKIRQHAESKLALERLAYSLRAGKLLKISRFDFKLLVPILFKRFE